VRRVKENGGRRGRLRNDREGRGKESEGRKGKGR